MLIIHPVPLWITGLTRSVQTSFSFSFRGPQSFQIKPKPLKVGLFEKQWPLALNCASAQIRPVNLHRFYLAFLVSLIIFIFTLINFLTHPILTESCPQMQRSEYFKNSLQSTEEMIEMMPITHHRKQYYQSCVNPPYFKSLII